MEWQKLLYFLGAIVLIVITVWVIRSNPQLFTKQNLNRSFFTMGILALILIIFLTLLVLFLRAT